MTLTNDGRRRVQVLVVDDSPTQRGLLAMLVNSDPDLTVIGWASNGADAVRATSLLKPDVIAMDLRMPVMDGLEATRQILRQTPTPIVLVTATPGTAAHDEQRLAFEALDAGVLAVISKPRPGPDGQVVAAELCRTLKNVALVRVLRRTSHDRLVPPGGPLPPLFGLPGSTLQVVAIGASTGGPQALRDILASLPADFKAPVLVVQHIAVGFATGLVDWLGPQCRLPVRLAVDGQPLDEPGIWVAPPLRHMGVKRRTLMFEDGPPVSFHCPSATRLFQSVAHEYGRTAIGVLLTGMGDDGALGLRDMKRAGATTIAQDEASSVVFGMPWAAIKLGVVDHVLPPPSIGPILVQRSRP